MNTSAAGFDGQFQSLLAHTNEPDPQLIDTVQNIINDIRQRGDVALLEYTNRFDRRNATLADLEIPVSMLQDAIENIPDQMRQALETSADRIRVYHEKQKQESWLYKDQQGNTLGQQVTPLDRVGVYVPGGKAAYPSHPA